MNGRTNDAQTEIIEHLLNIKSIIHTKKGGIKKDIKLASVCDNEMNNSVANHTIKILELPSKISLIASKNYIFTNFDK